MEMWGANLPVCHIFRGRGIDVYSSFSPRSGEAELVQLFSLQVPHAAEQSNPCFFAWRSLGATVTLGFRRSISFKPCGFLWPSLPLLLIL